MDARYTSINIIPEKNKRESTFIVEICYKKKGGGIFPNTCGLKLHNNRFCLFSGKMITVQPTDISSNEHITL